MGVGGSAHSVGGATLVKWKGSDASERWNRAAEEMNQPQSVTAEASRVSTPTM